MGERHAHAHITLHRYAMKRSQSYSVISSSIANKIEPEEENSKLNRTIDHEQYRDYFLKFIDLVIVRETTAASRTMKQET